MAAETHISNIYNFLKQYPPFDLIASNELKALSESVSDKTFDKDEKIFGQGDKPLDYFFVVQNGVVHIIEEGKEGEKLINICDEGDIFGMRAGIAQDMYIAKAIAAEETLLITVPIEPFKKIIEENAKVAMFLLSGFASGVSILKTDSEEHIRNTNRFLEKLNENKSLEDETSELNALNLNSTKRVIDCSPDHTIKEAAKIMSIFNVGSIVVLDKAKKPIGIVTDSDFRKKVVALEETIKHHPITEIMSSPVKTIQGGMSVTEAMLKMVSNRITHLVVTKDGTDQTEVLGVVSQRDVLIAQGNNPAVLAKQITTTDEIPKLAILRERAEFFVHSYLQKNVGIPFIANIITEINDILMQKAIDIAIQKLEKENLNLPQLKFCWLALGSEGRKEQLLRTDQDNALIYENPPESEKEYAKKYFLRLGKEVIEILIACGFERCPAELMANNPQWRQPVSNWENYFGSWIKEPDDRALLNATIFFDFRPIYGDFGLANDLKEFIFQEINKTEIFLPWFARNALLSPPPLSFFRSFIVEKSGAHKNEFDIKVRALMPLTDAARVLAFQFQLKNYLSTYERFLEVAKLEDNLKNICEEAAMAYEILLKIRATQGLKHKNSGRYINPDDFNKLERQTLRNIFKTIEKVQQILEVRFRLGFLR